MLAIGAGVMMLASPPAGAQDDDGGTPRVLATTVDAAITPVIADHLDDGISQAAEEGYDAYLIRLDTPGGLDTSMRSIIKDILASEVPVIVYISPSGARGASAGAIIGFSSHVLAMAPGTSIGAATPIDGSDGSDLDDKIVNDATAYAEDLAELRDRDVEFVGDTVRDGRSAGSTEALELEVIDAVATSDNELLELIDGRPVELGATPDSPGREVTPRTAGAAIDDHDMGILRTIQQYLADPNIAFLLLSIGALGLVYELASPGLGVGGALGAAFLVLGFFGLAVLPVDVVGVLFLLLAIALFVAEVFAPGIGLAAAGGGLFLLLSGIFLFEDVPGLELSLMVVIPTAVVLALFVVIAGRLAYRARRAPSTTTGVGLYVGRHGHLRVRDDLSQLFIEGAWWSARPRDPSVTLVDGQDVDIVAVDGLELVVEPHQEPDGQPNATRHVQPVDRRAATD